MININKLPLLLDNNIVGKIYCEKNVQISNSFIQGPIWLGFGSYINKECVIRSYTEIGRYCSIGRRCHIGLGLHDYSKISISPLFRFNDYKVNVFCNNDKTRRVIIGNDVWIGDYACIKSGIKIGNGAVIGACSLVTHNVDNYEIVGGVPARSIKKRFSDDLCKELLDIAWWRFSPVYLEEAFLNSNILNVIQFLRERERERERDNSLYMDINYLKVE